MTEEHVEFELKTLIDAARQHAENDPDPFQIVIEKHVTIMDPDAIQETLKDFRELCYKIIEEGLMDPAKDHIQIFVGLQVLPDERRQFQSTLDNSEIAVVSIEDGQDKPPEYYRVLKRANGGPVH